tara:strand:+ start:477 stop:704 length:228 start_codon:yes stop_codon:yes gene_type:complete
MKPGDYIEILQSNPVLGPQTLRGIILEVDTEIGLWPACRVYLFENGSVSRYYEYEITVISEANEDGKIQDILSCV